MLRPTRRTFLSLAPLFFLVACGGSTPPPRPPDPPPSADAAAREPESEAPDGAAARLGPAGFPMPEGAEPSPGGAGNVLLFKIARGREAVAGELRGLLAAEGWTIDSESMSPSGNAIRWQVSKQGTVVKASMTGDDSQAALILTVPAATP